MSNSRGFTLIELLVVVSLLGIVSLAIYGALSGGVSLSRKVISYRSSSDTLLDWKRLQKDFRRQMEYQSIPFIGLEEEVTFASLVPVRGVEGGVGGHEEVGRIRYYRNTSSGSLCRERLTVVEFTKGGEGYCQPVFSSIAKASFQYYGQATKGKGAGTWSSTWERDFPPLAVRLNITMEGEIERQFTTVLP